MVSACQRDPCNKRRLAISDSTCTTGWKKRSLTLRLQVLEELALGANAAADKSRNCPVGSSLGGQRSAFLRPIEIGSRASGRRHAELWRCQPCELSKSRFLCHRACPRCPRNRRVHSACWHLSSSTSRTHLSKQKSSMEASFSHSRGKLSLCVPYHCKGVLRLTEIVCLLVETPKIHLQRAARSQISTAVSFEGARPAGSAAVAARSADEDSAHSFADPEGLWFS